MDAVNVGTDELYGWKKSAAPGLTVPQRRLNPDSLAMYAAGKSSSLLRCPHPNYSLPIVSLTFILTLGWSPSFLPFPPAV
jgi:hypothetical protein